MSERAIHIHEDDWGMRNLNPVGTLFEGRAEVIRAADAADRNRAPDGVGFTDIHVINGPSIGYSDIGLELSVVADALGIIMPRVKRFAATAMVGFEPNTLDAYGSYEEEAYCYGFDETCFIKLDRAGVLVKQIWFECRTALPDKLAALAAAILAVDALAESAVADYWLDRVGRIRDPAFFNGYLRQLAGEQS